RRIFYFGLRSGPASAGGFRRRNYLRLTGDILRDRRRGAGAVRVMPAAETEDRFGDAADGAVLHVEIPDIKFNDRQYIRPVPNLLLVVIGELAQCIASPP